MSLAYFYERKREKGRERETCLYTAAHILLLCVEKWYIPVYTYRGTYSSSFHALGAGRLLCVANRPGFIFSLFVASRNATEISHEDR